jgi:pimeloyl-ACP methyl ester carboxylesterase
MSDRFDVTTPDGRTLGVHAGGAETGPCVVVLHGTPASGTLYAPNAADAVRLGLRLISYDRPGYGGSDRQPGRTVADAAADVLAIADHLGAERFAVWGHSGGGPHALACAALLGERLAACAAASGPAPYDADGLDWMAGMGEGNIEEFGLALKGGPEHIANLESMRDEMLAATPAAIEAALATLLSPVDRDALDGELAELFVESTKVALARGVDGWHDDDQAFLADWGFDFDAIDRPLRIYHGRQDLFVPPSHAEWLADRIPAADARITDTDGHLTIFGAGARDCHVWFAEALAASQTPTSRS